MEQKVIEVLNELSNKKVKCICANYEDFISDCDEMTMLRYRKFNCNPKNQFNKKAITVLTNAIYEERFFPNLFFIRLNKNQSTCHSQIDFTFELMDKAFLENDDIRKNELPKEMLDTCLLPDVDYVMIYIGMNR